MGSTVKAVHLTEKLKWIKTVFGSDSADDNVFPKTGSVAFCSILEQLEVYKKVLEQVDSCKLLPLHTQHLCTHQNR